MDLPISRPSKIVCVGLNYAKHATASLVWIYLANQFYFLNQVQLSLGRFDPIIIPKNSTKTDWEVELAVVIGKKASYITKKNALKHVAGYVLHNDVSEREFQIERLGQWVKGKSCGFICSIRPIYGYNR